MALPSYTQLGPNAGARCLVIGGCGGIGLEYVQGLVAAQADVVVIDLPASLEQVPLPAGVASIPLDVTDHAALDQCIRTLGERWQGFDVLAYVTGINTAPTFLADVALDDFETILNVNLTAAFVATRAALPFLKKGNDAAIVLVSSTLHANAEAGFAAYCASKGGLVSLSKVLAKEGAPEVRSNVVAPGLVDTAFLSGGTGHGGTPGGANAFLERQGVQGERIRTSIPLGRLAVASEIALPMLFLSGPASLYMTGETLYVNGGRYTA